MSEEANIDAYFERIGFAGSIAPTLQTLELLHALHPAVIPFENLDPLMQVPVRLELSNLQQKLLFERRGGYCLEQNLLFKAVLETLGFPVRGLGARVLLGHPEGGERPISHVLLAVDIGGATYIADVGFGGQTPTAPLRLKADVEQPTPHEAFRLSGGEPEWRLEFRRGEAWQPLYSFDLSEKSFEDYQSINDMTSSGPTFSRNLVAARAEKGRRLTLRNDRFTIHPLGGAAESRTLSGTAELREVLSGPFGIALPQSDRLEPALEKALAQAAAAAD